MTLRGTRTLNNDNITTINEVQKPDHQVPEHQSCQWHLLTYKVQKKVHRRQTSGEMQEANLETTTGSSVTNEQWIFEDAKCDRHKQLCSAEITVSEAKPIERSWEIFCLHSFHVWATRRSYLFIHCSREPWYDEHRERSVRALVLLQSAGFLTEETVLTFLLQVENPIQFYLHVKSQPQSPQGALYCNVKALQ